MEVAQVLCMKGGNGDTSYAKNSLVQVDRRYLADQQESNCLGSAATNRDQVQQTKVSCNKQKPVKNVSKKEVSQLGCCRYKYKKTSVYKDGSPFLIDNEKYWFF